MVHHDDGQWAGYSFEWNDPDSDVSRAAEGKQKRVGGQTWTYPGRSACLSCHTTAAGLTLGPEVAQLNGDILYPQTGLIGNELETLEFVGMFDAPLPAAPDNLDRLPRIDDGNATLEDRARAYLHANCAMCHRPNGPGQGSEDFRYWLPSSQIGAIDQEPTQGDLGLATPKLIAPGSPQNSVLLQRMLTLDVKNRMPPLASAVVDAEGAQLVTNWIDGMPASDIVDVVGVDYDALAQALEVHATSTLDDAVELTAYTKNNGVLTELGALGWLPVDGVHAATFPGMTVCARLRCRREIGGGYEEVPLAGNCSAGPGGTPEIVPLTSWLGAVGGVSASGNQVSYNGAPGQWNANSIYWRVSQPWASRSPSRSPSLWTVIRRERPGSWASAARRARSSGVTLTLRSGTRTAPCASTNGTYVSGGPSLEVGDVLSIYVNAGVVEYRRNGANVRTSSYSGRRNFYVDTSFHSVRPASASRCVR